MDPHVRQFGMNKYHIVIIYFSSFALRLPKHR